MARNFVSASSQYLELTSAVLSAEPITMSAWCKAPTGTGVARTLVGLSQSSGGTARCLLQIDTADRPAAFSSNSAGTSGTITTTGAIPNNDWAHAAAVFAASNSRTAFLNGTPSTTNTTSVSSLAGVNRTNVGVRYNGTPGTFMQGLIAEAAIWSAALTGDEIAALAKGVSPLLVRPGALAAYWPLLGRFSPEIDLKGGAPLTLVNAPTAGDHCRILRRATGRRRVV